MIARTGIRNRSSAPFAQPNTRSSGAGIVSAGFRPADPEQGGAGAEAQDASRDRVAIGPGVYGEAAPTVQLP
jgi:hypothetical protein